MTLKEEVAEKLRAVLLVEDSKIVWAPRTPTFYAINFTRAYNPEGAAEEWNKTKAGKPPRWQYDAARGDFSAYAHKRLTSLKEVCEALGIDYLPQRHAVHAQVTAYNRNKAKIAAQRSVEIRDGNFVWARRTRKTHPKTDQLLLDEFNRDFAGKQIKPHKSNGMYRISFHYIPPAELLQWLQEKEAK